MEKKHTCCKQLYRGLGWCRKLQPCGAKASVERDGKWYCKRHDPVAVKAKQEESDQKYKEKVLLDDTRNLSYLVNKYPEKAREILDGLGKE